jgi:hypothetical protein
MNRNYIWNLKEAADELNRTIRQLESEPDFSEVELFVAMQHFYHHLNTAWNAKSASAQQANVCSQEDFTVWRSFSTDIPMDDAD